MSRIVELDIDDIKEPPNQQRAVPITMLLRMVIPDEIGKPP